MKARLKLNNPMWRKTQRRKLLDRAVQESAAELEGEIKQTVLNSTPRGRLYRRGAITRAATKPLKVLGLRAVKGNPKRLIAGAKIHRASAKGQPFASDTGNTLNSIRAKKTGEMKAKVASGSRIAEILDNPNKLDRPFFKTVAEKFKPKFKENVLTVIRENTD